jgi:hypothetical protein
MKKVVAMHLLVVLLLVSTWGLAEAAEVLVPYDTFEMGPISPDRWSGASLGPDLFSPNGNLYEQNRSIIVDPSGVGRDLRVLNRSYGLTNSDVGIALGAYGLEFKNPVPVTAIRARMQVLSAVSKGCLTNPSPTIAQARLDGFFFNVAPATTGLTDAVLAQVAVQRRSNSADPANVFEVVGSVLHCLDFDCISANPIGLPSGIVPLGKVTVGQWVKGLVQWDQANQQFIFQRDNQPQKLVSYNGVVTDADPTAAPIKGLGVTNLVPNCTSTPRPFASMNALFDNVAVNQSALPQ